MIGDKIKTIKKLSKDINLLYVEDNIGLCANMQKLLERVSDNVIIANDGEEGYKQFLEHEPKIIITDINMPKMNGFKMIKKIQALKPECKIIILSAHDEKKHLHAAINLDVFRYLNKPAKIQELIDTLYDTVLSIHKEENRRLFLNQLQNIFNYQNNIVVMMFEGRFILPNQRFLEFFGVDSLEEFNEKFDMNKLLLEHKEFLYSTDAGPWYETAIKNPETLFHTKIENHEGIKRHLILKSRDVPEKEGHYILSLDDVTELNLMALFDNEAANNDNIIQDKMAVITFMKIVKNNSAEVKIHNFYKGLTIVNPAVLIKITDDEIVLKTVNSQLKILQLTKFTTISSEIFPQSVVCRSID
nr:response regulator [Sulfurimonas sp.]